jgi:hypothetical protein
MSFQGDRKIDEYLTFTVNTHNTSGVAADADAVPSYRIYEDETGTAIVTGTMAKLDDANTVGFYSERLQLTAANGFEVGKDYTIYVAVVVAGITATTSHLFKVLPIAVPADLTYVLGSALSQPAAGSLAEGITIFFADVGFNTFSTASADILTSIQNKTNYLPSATAGAAGGVFIAGTNAATTVEITGSLTGSVGSVTGVTFPANFNNLTLDNINTLIVTESGLQKTYLEGVIVATPTAVWGVGIRTTTGGTITTVSGNVDGNVGGSINGFTVPALQQLITVDTTLTAINRVAGSVADLSGNGVVNGLSVEALGQFITVDTTLTILDKVAGSVVDIADSGVVSGLSVDALKQFIETDTGLLPADKVPGSVAAISGGAGQVIEVNGATIINTLEEVRT